MSYANMKRPQSGLSIDFQNLPRPGLPELETLDAIYAKRDWWSNRLRSAEDRKARAEKTIEQCLKHVGPRIVTEQIAAAMQHHFPQYLLTVHGPFGLGSRTSIHAEGPEGTTEGSLAFRPVGDFLGLIDYDVNTHEYPPNSLGGINGFNHPTTNIPLGGIESLVALLRTRIATTVNRPRKDNMLTHASTNLTNPDAVATLLNDYEGDDIWTDIIKPLDGYNEFSTLALTGRPDRFIVNFLGGWQILFRRDKESGKWNHLPYRRAIVDS